MPQRSKTVHNFGTTNWQEARSSSELQSWKAILASWNQLLPLPDMIHKGFGHVLMTVHTTDTWHCRGLVFLLCCSFSSFLNRLKRSKGSIEQRSFLSMQRGPCNPGTHLFASAPMTRVRASTQTCCFGLCLIFNTGTI